MHSHYMTKIATSLHKNSSPRVDEIEIMAEPSMLNIVIYAVCLHLGQE